MPDGSVINSIAAGVNSGLTFGGTFGLLGVVELAALVVIAPRLWRAARAGRRLTTAKHESIHNQLMNDGEPAALSDAPSDAPRLSIVIPARNEATRLAECLAPLRDASGIHEIIVVDDESTDTTSEVAHRFGARVIRGAPLPSGWVGKIWAIEQGIAAAQGDVVITLDADARPAPELVESLAKSFTQSGAVFATVAPRFRTSSPSGQWLHAAMLTSLVYRHGAGAGRSTKDTVANGQCMIFRRTDAVDGKWCHEVQGSTIEDVALARWLVSRNQHVEMFDGGDVLTVQMYEGFTDTWRGWGRSLALTGVDSRQRQLSDAVVTLLTLVAPLWLLLFGIATPLTLLLLITRIGTLIGARRAYERPSIGYWLSPIADVLVWVIVVRGIVAPTRQWRGRQY